VPYSEGNLFSILAFFLWIPIALWGAYRWPSAKAAALLLLIPLMFLPEQVYFKIPGLPIFTKQRIAVFWLFVGVLLFHRDRLRSVRIGRWVKLSMLLLVGGNVITMFTNSDAIKYGAVNIPAHVPYDAVHVIVEDAFDYVLPLIFGAAMFKDRKELSILLRIVAGAGLVYSVLQLVEIRLSPQLHNWVYGFFQHSFSQTIRGGGFRPTVFMEHGIAVAMFNLVAVTAAAVLYKVKSRVLRIPSGWVLPYLWLVLLLSKSAAAFLYSLVAVPLILLASPKTQLRVAILLGVIVLIYPTLRGSGLVPVDDINAWVTSKLGEDRAGSLMFRFVNEERLLEHANERYFFGWGWYGRGYTYNPDTGDAAAIRDGDWVITLGDWGRVGFFGKYLLLLMPLFIVVRQLKWIRRESDRRLLAALGLTIGFSAFDLLPNGNFNHLIFVFSGAIMSCSAGILRQQARSRMREKQATLQPAPSQALPEPDVLSLPSGSST
jgi:hypothetical protein